MLTILGLNGTPLGSIALILQISTMSLRAFCLTLVFLWVHQRQANSMSYS